MSNELQPLVSKLGIQEIGEEIQLNVVNTFSEGMYVRELHIPKGTLIEGKRHRKKTMNMLIKGHMTIYDGKETYEIHAPFIAESEAFIKKTGFAHEDSVWVNIHTTNSTDLDEIEAEFIISEEEYIEKERICHG